MSAIYHKLLLFVFLGLGLISCNSGTTLEEYYVDQKENPDFVSVDIPASLISPNSDRLTSEQKRVLQTVKKVNILALPLKSDNQAEYDQETAKVKQMLSYDDFEQLMTVGKPSQRMQLYVKGDTDAIDEMVVFAKDDAKGFVLARLLGDDMNVGDLVKLAETMNKNGDSLDLSQFEGVMDVFGNQ